MDDLSKAEDQGGNRGGGTAIVNPPKEPVSVPDPPASPEPEKDNGSSDEPGEGEADSDPKNISQKAGQQGKASIISPDVPSDKNKRDTAGSTEREKKSAERSNINDNTMDAGNTWKEQTAKASGSSQPADAMGGTEKTDIVEKANADDRGEESADALSADENREGSADALPAGDSGKYKADFPWVLLAALLVLSAAAGMIFLVRYRRMR